MKIPTAVKLTLSVEPVSGALTLADEQNEAGWFGLRFYVKTPAGILTASEGGLVRQTPAETVWTGRLNEAVTVTLTVTPAKTGNGWCVTP